MYIYTCIYVYINTILYIERYRYTYTYICSWLLANSIFGQENQSISGLLYFHKKLQISYVCVSEVGETGLAERVTTGTESRGRRTAQ